jgi:hypothetical protein
VTDQGNEGAYAEKIAINAAIIAKKPDRLNHAEAAALGLTSLTALTAIEDTAQLKAGQTILIQGGAGGVAGFALQLCKHLLWVKSRHVRCKRSCPLYPQKRTRAVQLEMSAMGQKRTTRLLCEPLFLLPLWS